MKTFFVIFSLVLLVMLGMNVIPSMLYFAMVRGLHPVLTATLTFASLLTIIGLAHMHVTLRYTKGRPNRKQKGIPGVIAFVFVLSILFAVFTRSEHTRWCSKYPAQSEEYPPALKCEK